MEILVGTTIVKPRMTVRRGRLLPAAGDVVARSGQEVSPMQVVARMPRKVHFHVLPVSETLGISAAQLRERLLVREGEDVSAGTVLVERQGLFGKASVSPVDGILFRVQEGRIILQQTSDWNELRALMVGRVVRRIPDRGVILEADGAMIQGVWSSDREGFGELRLLSGTPDDSMPMERLTEDASGHVIAVASIDSSDVLRRAAELDVTGLIVGSMTAELCQLSLSLPFPVIMTDGVGHRRMAQQIFDLLQESDGRQASLFGQLDRSHPIRPEIVFSHSPAPKTDPPAANQPIAVGQTVRIFRSPYSSQIGEIVSIFTRSQRTSVGTKAQGANVRLQDGHVVFVPFNNLDILVT